MKRIILPIVALLICNFSNAQICSKAQLPLNLQNGLVGYYPFCGNANDGSGNGYNGVVSGATLAIDRFGNTNNSYSFLTGNHINLPTNLTWNNLQGLSFSVWAKFNTIVSSAGGGNTVIELTDGPISNQWPHRYFIVQDANKIHFSFEGTASSGGFRISSNNVSQNQWYHIVGIIRNNQAQLYINGILTSTANIPISIFNLGTGVAGSKRFGMATNDGGSPLRGALDDIQIYNRALTPCEVNQIYTSTNTTFTTPSILTFNPLPTQISLCGSSIGLDAGSGFTSYLWNTGATSQTISATTAGEYRVTVTNASGCTASDTINVSLVKVDILQSDQTVCVNTPLTLSVNSYASQSAKTIDFDNVGLAALDVTGGTAGSVSGVSGNGLSISRPTEVKTKDQTYGYGDYEVDAKTGTNTSNQYLSVLLPLNSWSNEAISIDSRPAGTDDVGWGVYVNAVRVAFANGTHPAGASTWYKMKIRVTPDSVKCWINSTLLYQGLNTTVPRNIGAVKLSTFSTSHFDNLKYIPYQTFSSILWSTSATTSTISVTPTATTTYYATISDGISSCRDSVTLTVANIVGFAPLQDTVKVCGDSLVLDAGAGFASYNWSSGATTRIVTAKTSGRYIATVFNASGCSASDTSVVSIVKAKILQRDTTICKGSSITLAVDSLSLNKSSACLKSSLPAQLQNGLIAYYPFCGNANDGSGNGINGILFGAPTLVADRFGNSNAAYNFNGTNQYIQTGSISEPVTTKTISAWVKLSNMSQMGGGLAAVQSANGSVFDAIVYNETNNGWGFGSDNLTRTRWSGVKETSSTWVMLTATYENNSYKLYRNGILISSTTQFPITSFGTSSKFNIGLRHDNGGTPYLNGAIDDVFFYNRVLTSSEIMSLYNTSSSVNWSNGAITNTITVSPTVTTKYFVTVTDGVTTCKDSITVTVSDISSFNPLQDTVKVCGDSAVLDASIITIAIYPPVAGNTTYRWSNGATTKTISAKASGKYYVTVTNASGCSASDTSFVSIVKANIIQSDTTICKGTTIRLSADTLVRGLLAYYPLDNNAQDLSGNNMNGVVTGATPTTDRFGQANKAYFFNGTSDFIKVNHDARLNRLPLTVSCWFNANQQISPAGALVGKYYAASWTGWQLTLNEYGPSSQRLDPWYIRGSNNYVKNSSTTPNFYTTSIIDSSWHHIAFVIDSTSGKIYLDGNLQATANWVGPAGIPSNTWPMYFGYYPSGNAPPNIYYYRGKIDDIRLYDKALNNSEVQSAMSSTVTQYQYLWSNGATTPTIEVTPNITTKYFVTVTDGITTCKDSVTITVDDLSSFNPLQDTVKVCGDSIVLDAGAGYATYNWSNGATTRTINVKTSGKYIVTAVKASGCSASDTSILSIVKAKILQKDTTICKGSGISIKVDAIGVSSNSIFKGPNQKDSLIISKYLDYRSRSSFTTPNLSPGNYYLKVSGTFSYGAGRLNDAAYDVYNGITSKADRFFSWNEFCVQGDTSCKIYRPSPDVYNPSHVYYYPFTTNGGVQTIYGISDDCCWGDNSGGLTFEFYKQVNNDLLITWSTGDTTTSITVNPTVKTTYRVTVTDGITTCTDSVVVDVSSSELKVTDPVAVCSPALVNLTATAITSGSATGLTYTYWRDSSATQALSNPDKVSVSGTYYIIGKSATGCTSAPTAVKVTVNPLPVATIFAPNQTAICDKSTIRLTASGGTTYQWLFNGSIIAGATDSSFAASQAGSYEVNVIAKGCTSKVAAPVNLTLIKAAVPKFSNSSTCIDVPVSFFNETDTTASGSVNYVWDLGDGQTSTLFNPVYTYKKSGAFVVKLKVAPKLCSSLSDSVTKSITVDVPPVGIKYPNVLAVKNKATPLSARFIANGYSYLWMPSTGLNNGAIQKPVFNANQEQLYRVRLTSAGGCITMDTVKVSVYDSSDIFVPKAFSPNKDGKNDLLQPFLVNIVTLKFFKVYNRWGQLMFQSSDSRQGWDGMYNYKPQPLETYTWIAEGVDGNGTTIFRKGQTVLIR